MTDPGETPAQEVVAMFQRVQRYLRALDELLKETSTHCVSPEHAARLTKQGDACLRAVDTIEEMLHKPKIRRHLKLKMTNARK